jgi:hypothetical protein
MTKRLEALAPGRPSALLVEGLSGHPLLFDPRFLDLAAEERPVIR